MPRFGVRLSVPALLFMTWLGAVGPVLVREFGRFFSSLANVDAGDRLAATVSSIDGCDSGVANTVLAFGCSINDLIDLCAVSASNHGQFDQGGPGRSIPFLLLALRRFAVPRSQPCAYSGTSGDVLFRFGEIRCPGWESRQPPGGRTMLREVLRP